MDHLQNFSAIHSRRRPKYDTFCTFSPPFGMPQPRGSKPSPLSPAYKSPSYPPCHDWLLSCCQASCAVRGDFGSCGLLRILRALSTSCTQRQQCCCKVRHTQPHTALQKGVGFSQGKQAAGVSTSRLQWASAPTLSCRKEGRGQVKDAADRGSDVWSQSELSFRFTTPWLKQTDISIHWNPLWSIFKHNET